MYGAMLPFMRLPGMGRLSGRLRQEINPEGYFEVVPLEVVTTVSDNDVFALLLST